MKYIISIFDGSDTGKNNVIYLFNSTQTANAFVNRTDHIYHLFASFVLFCFYPSYLVS